MLLPALAAAKRKAQRINCVNNLKEIGLAFRIWEGDNHDQYPMSVSTASGGAQEFVVSANHTAGGIQGGVARVFGCMSNELSTPKILICTSDSATGPSTNCLRKSTGRRCDQPCADHYWVSECSEHVQLLR